MNERNHYDAGAIHNDHHKEINIEHVTERGLKDIISSFFKDDAEDAEVIEEVTVKKPQEAHKKKSPAKKAEKPPKPRETMTFKRRGQVTDGHLTLIFMKLLEEKWIDGNEADFKALFAGVPDEDCILTWKGTFGKSTLVELFRQMVGSGLVVVPDGFTVPGILEGHFKDESGAWLTGLGKGDKPAVKALPQIARCVKVLKATPQSLMSGGLDDDDDFVTEYDPYDHQDLQYHH